jgi:hypothetical protein
MSGLRRPLPASLARLHVCAGAMQQLPHRWRLTLQRVRGFVGRVVEDLDQHVDGTLQRRKAFEQRQERQ